MDRQDRSRLGLGRLGFRPSRSNTSCTCLIIGYGSFRDLDVSHPKSFREQGYSSQDVSPLVILPTFKISSIKNPVKITNQLMVADMWQKHVLKRQQFNSYQQLKYTYNIVNVIKTINIFIIINYVHETLASLYIYIYSITPFLLFKTINHI